MILERLTNLLSEPQGSLAYHLIATLTIGLIFLLAQTLRRRAGSASLRWRIASGPLAAARFGMLLLAGSTALAAPDLAPMLAPLERYLTVAGGLVLAWAFLFPHPQRTGDLGFAAVLAVCSVALAVSALPLALGGGAAASAGLAAAWDLGGLLSLAAAAGLLFIRRPVSWPAAAGGMGLLAVGFGVQLASGSEVSAPLRFAELLAYPALSVAAAWALSAMASDGPAPVTGEVSARPSRPELMPDSAFRGLQAAAAAPGPDATLKGSEDSEQVAQLKAEFRLALQELADITRDRSAPEAGGEGISMPVVGSLGDAVQGMRRALTSVLSCTELLGAEASGTLDPKHQDLLARLREDVLKLSAQVTKLGELTSETAAQVVSGAAESNLLGCLRGALDQLAGPIQEKRLSFSMSIPEDLPLIRARPGDLERLLALMIESAIASTFPGTQVQIRSAVERTPGGSLVSLSVADSGQGFSPEEVAQAFQPWHQLEGPSSGGTRAFGISLAGLRQKAELLGGRVWVASELGAGTTITVLLPAITPQFVRE